MLGATLLVALPGSAAASASESTILVGAGLRVAAPPAGVGVSVSAITTSGEGLEVVVETDRAGVTRVLGAEAHVARARALDGVAASPGPCRDRSYTLIGFRWSTPWAWRFRASSTPAGMSKAKAEAHLRAAVRSITAARNGCGMPDRVSAKARYLGRTSKKPGVQPGGLCRRTDGHNVVGFGELPLSIAGVTCTWYSLSSRGMGRAIESDVLLNRSQGWASNRASCSRDQVILRSIATHEFGHVFGLGHVREATHGNLTMSEAIGPCDDSAFTLGRGDILGLERLY